MAPGAPFPPLPVWLLQSASQEAAHVWPSAGSWRAPRGPQPGAEGLDSGILHSLQSLSQPDRKEGTLMWLPEPPAAPLKYSSHIADGETVTRVHCNRGRISFCF